jgi:hypothetical protein
MSHFAKVLDGKVVQVIVAEPEFFNTFVDSSPGNWIQTSYNTRGGIHYDNDCQPDNGTPLRGNYGGIGFIYDAVNDVFYEPRPIDRNGLPCNSWTISVPTWTWKCPIQPNEDDKKYIWDEPTKSWVEIK